MYAVGVYGTDIAQTFRLQMAMGVGAEKMSSALADALKPRCSDAKDIEAFEVSVIELVVKYITVSMKFLLFLNRKVL